MRQYLKSARHRAARFAAGMATSDVEALIDEINTGRDPAKSDIAIFNGASIYIIKAGSQTLTANPGNWIVKMPDGSLDVHADADFCSNYCAAAS